MSNKLREYFPAIKTREEVKRVIFSDSKLEQIYSDWEEEQQKEFLDFCSGAKGVKVLYDSFFKEIFNPETVPERLERLLSLILKQKVKILNVLPNDSARIADEKSLLETDIVVELEDGSLANVEIQKIGYKFPGERSACYSADLLLRQYKRVRSRRKKRFSYKNIKNVYVIVFMESSSGEFKEFPDEYIHFFEQKSDTGLEMNLLQKYYYIPLDIFRKSLHNKGVQNELGAWLAFLSEDDPVGIISLIEEYPAFRPLYKHIYDICGNVEDVMGLFSKELLELDRNTVQLMIDEMTAELNEKKAELSELTAELNEINAELNEKDARLHEKDAELSEKDVKLHEKDAELNEKDAKLNEKDAELNEKDMKLHEKDAELNEKDAKLHEKDAELNQKEEELEKEKKRVQELLQKIEELQGEK